MKVSNKIPDGINYDKFKWLSKGDRIKIADKVGKSRSMVRMTLRKETYNIEILTEAMIMVVEKQKKLLEKQAESDRLEAALQMKIA